MKQEPILHARIHAQNCGCPRCAPWRRRSTLDGYRAIWRAADPGDRAALLIGLNGGALVSAIILTAHFAPALCAALGF